MLYVHHVVAGFSMGTSLLPTEGHQPNSSTESFYAANARKFAVLVLLLLIGSLGLGAKVFLGFEEPSVDISVLKSSYEVWLLTYPNPALSVDSIGYIGHPLCMDHPVHPGAF